MRKAFIETMFRTVDACDWPGLEAFYHPACTYDRPGFETLRGVAEVLRFYEHDRPIQEGLHRVDQVVEDGDAVCVTGRFDGRLRTGADLSLAFADIYRFEQDRIRTRTTYFYAPLA